MASAIDFAVLRTKTVASGDDADYVDTQAAPTDLVRGPLEVREDTRRPLQLEVTYEWQDVGGAVVVGAGRGTATLTPIAVLDRPGGGGPDIRDGVPQPLTPAGRMLLLEDVPMGDQIGIRVTAMVPPAGATDMVIHTRWGREV